MLNTDELFQTDVWLSLRWRALHESYRSCSLCGYGVSDGIKLDVLHREDPDTEESFFDMDNLVVLCSQCSQGSKKN